MTRPGCLYSSESRQGMMRMTAALTRKRTPAISAIHQPSLRSASLAAKTATAMIARRPATRYQYESIIIIKTIIATATTIAMMMMAMKSVNSSSSCSSNGGSGIMRDHMRRELRPAPRNKCYHYSTAPHTYIMYIHTHTHHYYKHKYNDNEF